MGRTGAAWCLALAALGMLQLPCTAAAVSGGALFDG